MITTNTIKNQTSYSRKTLNSISYRLFFTSLIRRQEPETMKPISGKEKTKC